MAIIGTLPNNIQNGQTVDANPVMADFNFIVNQVNANAAPLTSIPIVIGLYGTVNLAVINNAGAPSTSVDITADLVQLRNPGNGQITVQPASSVITNNTSTAGPIANGRDQVTAFGPNSFIHFYYIWNGSTLATLSSLNPPSAGPSLPSGYTFWCYVGAYPFGGSSQLIAGRIRKSEFSYNSFITASTGTASANVQTVVSLNNLVPVNASLVRYIVQVGIGITTSGSPSLSTFYLYTDISQFGNGFGLSSITSGYVPLISGQLVLPNVSQNVYFVFTQETNAGNIASRNFTINCVGYTMANGGV